MAAPTVSRDASLPPAEPGAPAPMPPAPAKRPPIPLLVAGVLALAAGAWGAGKVMHARHWVETDNAQVDGHITVIAPKVQAFIDRVMVDDNRRVKAGDTLVVLDARDLRVRLVQAEAELANALATSGNSRREGQARALVAYSEAQAASAQAAIASAEAQFRKAASDLARYKELAGQRIVAQQQLDAAQATYDASAANLEAVRKQAAAAGNQVSAQSAGLSGAEARLASAQAAVETARLNVSYSVITAPADGIVARRVAEVGALVGVGQTLMSLVPTSGIWVTANYKETDLNRIAVGARATFTVDAYPGRHFTGTVESISPATGARFALLPPDNATGNFTKVVQRVPVRVRVDEPLPPEAPLRPGMSVVVEVETK